MDQNGNGHNKKIKFQKLWSDWKCRNLFGFKISLPNFEISLEKSQSFCKKMYHLIKTFKYLPKISQHKLHFLSPASQLSDLFLSVLLSTLYKLAAFPELLFCSVELLIHCQWATASQRAEMNRSLFCYFLNSRKALYIPLMRDTASRSSLSTVTGAKFHSWSLLPSTTTLKWHALYLTASSPCLPPSQKNKAFRNRRLTFTLLSIFIHI